MIMNRLSLTMAHIAADLHRHRRACDNALAETTIGLCKTECIREGSPFRAGPLGTLADLEEITSAWVHWYNTTRLMHRLGLKPSAEAEAEAEYHQQHAEPHPGQARK
jgi:putative transposase